jgi:hypothetical protein
MYKSVIMHWRLGQTLKSDKRVEKGNLELQRKLDDSANFNDEIVTLLSC